MSPLGPSHSDRPLDRSATLSQPILVTGGAGFIGSHLTEALVGRGARVRVLDDLSSGCRENLAEVLHSGRVDLTVGSVTEPGLLESLAADCRQIYHLAASVGVAEITGHPLRSMGNNVEGVQQLYRALHALSGPPPRVILFSSSEVYGRSEEVPLREDLPFEFGPAQVIRWSYAACKAFAECLAVCEEREHGIPVTIVRCFNTSGPRQVPNFGMVIPRFFEQALRGEPITVYGDGRQTRCFSYVGDVVEGVLRLAESESTIGEVYNLGSDRETAVIELAERIRALTGSNSKIELVPLDQVFGPGFQEITRRVPDLGKLEAATGYRPRTSLDQLLALTFEWYRRTHPELDRSRSNGDGELAPLDLSSPARPERPRARGEAPSSRSAAGS